jgi:hypothetical protein
MSWNTAETRRELASKGLRRLLPARTRHEPKGGSPGDGRCTAARPWIARKTETLRPSLGVQDRGRNGARP